MDVISHHHAHMSHHHTHISYATDVTNIYYTIGMSYVICTTYITHTDFAQPWRLAFLTPLSFRPEVTALPPKFRFVFFSSLSGLSSSTQFWMVSPPS